MSSTTMLNMNQFVVLAFAFTLFGCAFALPTADKSCNCELEQFVEFVGEAIGLLAAKRHEPMNIHGWLVDYRNNRLYCGGAIISNKHVLTAAHCVHSFDRRDIKIFVGGHNITTDYVDTRRVSRVFEHEYFDTVSFDFDIALLELSKPVEFGPKIQPACLPQTQFEDYSGKSALIAGWGRLGEQSDTSNHLRQVVVPIWTAEECSNSDYGKKQLTSNMMCAGYANGGRDACQGDSGGPMHFEGQTGSMEVIGVVSWGRGCARPKLPGIYTRVANFLPWLQKKLGSTCLCSPKNGVRSGFLETILEGYNNENAVDDEYENEQNDDDDGNDNETANGNDDYE